VAFSSVPNHTGLHLAILAWHGSVKHALQRSRAIDFAQDLEALGGDNSP
jgi:hypothetical protein